MCLCVSARVFLCVRDSYVCLGGRAGLYVVAGVRAGGLWARVRTQFSSRLLKTRLTPPYITHTGHNINRMLQLFHARMDPNVPHIDWVVSNRMRMPVGSHNFRLVQTMLGEMVSKTWLRMVINELPGQAICMDRVMEACVCVCVCVRGFAQLHPRV